MIYRWILGVPIFRQKPYGFWGSRICDMDVQHRCTLKMSPCAQSRLKLQSVANPVQNTANALLAACVGPGTQQIRFACGLIRRL